MSHSSKPSSVRKSTSGRGIKRDRNSGRTLKEITSSIHANWVGVIGAEANAAELQLRIGADLLDAQYALRSNQDYGRWFRKQKFGFSLRWAWTLREAARRTPEVKAKLAQMVEQGRRPNIERALKQVLRQEQEAREERRVNAILEGRVSEEERREAALMRAEEEIDRATKTLVSGLEHAKRLEDPTYLDLDLLHAAACEVVAFVERLDRSPVSGVEELKSLLAQFESELLRIDLKEGTDVLANEDGREILDLLRSHREFIEQRIADLEPVVDEPKDEVVLDFDQLMREI